MAFVTREGRNGKPTWVLYWQDATRGASKAGRRRVACEGGDHADAMDAAELTGNERAALAAGATTAALRKRLAEAYGLLEIRKMREAARAGGEARHDVPLEDLVRAFLDLCRYREAIDLGGDVPLESDPGWRPRLREKPMAPKTRVDVEATLRPFLEWLRPGTQAGAFGGDLVALFLDHMAREVRKRRGRAAPRTFNKHRANIRSFALALTPRAARRYFKVDPRDVFAGDVEPMVEPKAEIKVHAPATLAAFLELAERYGTESRDVTRTRRGRVENFRQASGASVPILEAALVLACTGMRRGEAVNLRWSDVNLDSGLVTIRSTKTRKTRYLPLVADPAGDVCPRFLDLLRAWRERDRTADCVLRFSSQEWPTSSWENATRQAGLKAFSPQALRSTFESVLAAIGFPSPLAAIWLGHSPAVAYKHYLAFPQGRLPGRTVEEVLGLVPFLDRALGRARAGRAFRVVGSETA